MQKTIHFLCNTHTHPPLQTDNISAAASSSYLGCLFVKFFLKCVNHITIITTYCFLNIGIMHACVSIKSIIVELLDFDLLVYL